METNMILNLFIMLIVVLSAFVSIILLVKYRNKCTTEKAVETVSDFFKAIYKGLCDTQARAPLEFPVYIGCNEYGIRAQLVNQAFKKLERYWEVVYFDTAKNTANLLVYQFRIYNSINEDLKRSRLITLAGNVAEEALACHMREWQCFEPVDKFVATSIHGDLLYVGIAKNVQGFVEIEHLRKRT